MNRVFFASLLGSLVMTLATGCTGFAAPKAPHSATHQATNATADATVSPDFGPPPSQAEQNFKVDTEAVPVTHTETDTVDFMPGFEINDGVDRGQAARQFLSQAEASLAVGDFGGAVRAAAQSYHYWDSEEALTTAQYAASQMNTEALERSYAQRQPDSMLETAALGAQAALRCHMQGRPCPWLDRGTVALALDALGQSGQAQAVRQYSQAGVSTSQRPLVAVFLPLSGQDRRIGRAMLGALLQANGIYTHQGLKYDVRLFDTKSSAETIEGLMREAASLGAKLILGPIDAQECLASSKWLKTYDMVMLGFSLNDLFVGERAFQLSYGIAPEAQVLARFIIAQNKQKLASVYPNNRYGQNFAEQLEKAVGTSHGLKFSQHPYPETQVDLRDIAKKVAAEKADVIFFPSTAELAERMASFLAQENIWCAQPGAVPAKTDTRRFVTCIAPSAWSPIEAGHHYKFIQMAVYLDYIDASPDLGADFSKSFYELYHREASIYEIMPYKASLLLDRLETQDFLNAQTLQASLYRLLRGQRFILEPSLRQIKADACVSFIPASRDTLNSTERTLITRP